MLTAPGDILRLITKQIPHHQRVLRMTCQRLRTFFQPLNLPSSQRDIIELCRLGDLTVLRLYPISLLRATNEKTNLCQIAATHNQLEVLKWLRELNFGWTRATTESAAANGNFELLQWAIDNSCPFDTTIYYHLSRHNNIVMIRSLLTSYESNENSMPTTPSNVSLTANYQIFYGGATGGHLSIFQEFRDPTRIINNHVIGMAASKGHLDLLKWFYQQNHPMDEWICLTAAGGGHIEVIKWLRSIGCEWDDSVSAYAAMQGQLETLQWLVANGCPLTQDAVDDTAGNGHIEVLKWLRSQGFQFTGKATVEAALNKEFACLQWLRDQGCPWDEDLFEEVEHYYDRDYPQ